MCFGSKDTTDYQPAVRPANLPPHFSSTGISEPKIATMPSNYAPPPGPPFSSYPDKTAYPDKAPPAYEHPWRQLVPDNSELPPPPALGLDISPGDNATYESFQAGERWCRENPLGPPSPLSAQALNAVSTGDISLFATPDFRGELTQVGMGVWQGKCNQGDKDTCIASWPPLYSVLAHNPQQTWQKKTIYYEVNILDGPKSKIPLALGFISPPYPSFRLPGWHRGSLGVHGDDGHRYINDGFGGKPFTQPFSKGETLGLGMEIEQGEGFEGLNAQVFLTRNGGEVGRWDVNEPRDLDNDTAPIGVQGTNDLCAAIGVYEKVKFEVVFVPGRWRWRGYPGY